MLSAVIAGVIGLALGGVIFFYVGIQYRKKVAEATIESAENQAKKIVEDSKHDAERIKKEAILQAKDEMLKQKSKINFKGWSTFHDLYKTENFMYYIENFIILNMPAVSKYIFKIRYGILKILKKR